VKTSPVSGSGRYALPQISHLLVSTSVYKFFGGQGGEIVSLGIGHCGP
jgi:hypothetical protein